MKLDLAGYLSKQAIDAPSAPLFSRWRRLPKVWILGTLLTLLVSLVVVMPSLITAAYLAAGTRALGDSAAPAEHERAAQAAAYLKQALAWSPSNPDIYRGLAQSYLRLNQPQEAIDALEHAYRLRPESLLIQQELAQAYEAGAQTRRADALWAALGATPEHMTAIGDEALVQRRYADAFTWYSRAEHSSSKLPFDQLFKRAVVATLAANTAAPALLAAAHKQHHSFAVYSLDDRLSIAGRELRWMTSVPGSGVTYGTSLSYGVGTGEAKDGAGYLWWPGEALAVVSVERDSRYQFILHVREQTCACRNGAGGRWPAASTLHVGARR